MGHGAILFVVSGPSGVGKTMLVEHLLAKFPDTLFSVSYTTRAPRAGERDGRDYHFVARPEFEAMIARGEFLEHALVFDDHYGTHRNYLERANEQGKDLILDIDVQGAGQVKAMQRGGVLVFVLPPSGEELQRRLRGRGSDTAEVVERRLEGARREIRQVNVYDYVIINAEREQACREFEAIVETERHARRGGNASPAVETLASRCRQTAQWPRVSAILESFGGRTL